MVHAAPSWVGAAVRVRVPASSANIGPGFDSIGLALGIWDEYLVTVTPQPGLRIEVSGEGAADVPRDERHLVYRSMLRAFAALDVEPPHGLHLVCRNGVPHGRGLGSSATAIVAGIVAAQGLRQVVRSRDRDGCGQDECGQDECGQGECGEDECGQGCDIDLEFTNDLASAIEGHPDNASASVYGGMTLSWSDDVAPGRVHTVSLQVSADVIPLVFVPATRLPTSTARAVLPEHVPHAEAALNAARAALLVEAVTRRPDLLLPATREWLHQEQRRAAFPQSMALVDRLRAAGHAAVISGAGPSVLVLGTAAQSSGAMVLGQSDGWIAVTPGLTSTGAQVERVTLMTHPAETAGQS